MSYAIIAIVVGVLLALLFLVGLPLYNKYLRKQVYLVTAPIGSDSSSCASSSCSVGCPNSSPSVLSSMQTVAEQYSAEIATDDQLGAAAEAGANWTQWGWLQAGDAYVSAFPYPASGANGSPMAQALGCSLSSSSSSTAILQVNPCLSAVVPTAAACPDAVGSPNMTLSYSPTSASVSCSGPACAEGNPTMLCSQAGFVADYSRLGTSQCYQYNPSTSGVLLYGVKPAEGSDATVVPFNSAQYSQYSAYSL
jgi:hypothetical protein